MTTLVPYNEPPIPRIALEIERLRQRLDAAEAQLEARDRAPTPTSAGALAGGSVGRVLTGISAVATLALVVIAGSLVWQQTHGAPPANPTIVVQAAPSSVQTQAASPSAQSPSGQSAMQPSVQASAQAPAYRPPIVLPPPVRPGPRW